MLLSDVANAVPASKDMTARKMTIVLRNFNYSTSNSPVRITSIVIFVNHFAFAPPKTRA